MAKRKPTRKQNSTKKVQNVRTEEQSGSPETEVQGTEGESQTVSGEDETEVQGTEGESQSVSGGSGDQEDQSGTPDDTVGEDVSTEDQGEDRESSSEPDEQGNEVSSSTGGEEPGEVEESIDPDVALLDKALNDYVDAVNLNADIRTISSKHLALWNVLSGIVKQPDYEIFKKNWVHFHQTIGNNMDKAFKEPMPYYGTQRPHWVGDISTAGAYNILMSIVCNMTNPAQRGQYRQRLDLSRVFAGTVLDGNDQCIKNLAAFYRI